jgi:phospholipid/cholesterol/gamma-HCH transport system substrate-binding protein
MARRAIRRGGLDWSQARVGAFLIVALLLLAYGIYRVGDLFNVFADRYELVTLVPSAAGLLEGSAVTLAGQRVGQVDEIEFLPVTDGGPNHLSIRFSVDEKVREHIRADSWARIRTQGLLGDKYIDITPGTAAYAVLSPGDTIPSLASVELEDLLVIATETLDTLQLLISDMRQISTALVRGEGTLGHLLTDATLYERMVAGTTELRELLAQINDGDGTLGRIIRDPALYEELTGAIARVDSVALLILEGEGTVGRLLKDDELYQRLLAVVGRADTAIGKLGGALDGLANGGGTFQRMLTDPSLYDQLLKAIVDLQILIEEIRNNPRRFRPEVRIDIF